MRNKSRKPAPPGVQALEGRQLLALSGTWLGQDGHDLVGYSSTPGGNGYQDIHIALSGIDPARTIVAADVEGLGGGQWLYNGPPSSWLADIVRAPGSTTADLYIEPYQQDSGRPYDVQLTYDDGTKVDVWVNGGPVDPNLPVAALSASWLGSNGTDLVNPSPSVGPDGVADARIGLTGLSASSTIASVSVAGPNGLVWRSGLGSGGAWDMEVTPVAGDATRATLALAPPSNLAGQTLTVTVAYADGKSATATVVAGATNPSASLAAPAPFTLRSASGVSGAWIGQDGQDAAGDVHVAISGLPAGRTVVAADISDAAGGAWQYRANGQVAFAADPVSWSLDYRQGPGSTAADFFLPPSRDETGSTLTARLLLDDGSTLVTTIAGGAADLSQRSLRPAPTSVTAHPGDDLNALANAYGAVHLAAGTYALSRPLILNNPVTITADPGVTLLFSQAAGAAPWTAAIKIHAGNTTLDGFAVRFATTINWSTTVSYSPAVIGTTDDQDGPGFTDPMAALTLTHLDLQSPPAATSWEQAPSLLRLVSAAGGTVAGNTLKGGTTEVHGGPWTIVNNDYEGTVPGTYTFAAFAGHSTHDLVLAGNTAQPVGASGKTWRFLVLTQSGIGDTIQGNTVAGIGPQDDDTVPATNAPEIILAEAYQLHFEGNPSAISADGRTLQIPTPQGGAARTGDVVAILSGPDAGQYRRIAQAIDAQTYLMADPLPAGNYAISIATGFVDETYSGNTIDARGSSTAVPLVLAGTQFGTQVVGNTFLGGGSSFSIQATPTEAPVTWGWSHTPVLGLVVADNTLVDSASGGVLTIGQDPNARPDDGRVYMTATLKDNVVRWSASYLASLGSAGPPVAFVVGASNAIAPADLILNQSGNSLDVPAGTVTAGAFRVNSATIGGQALAGQTIALPTTAPAVAAPVLFSDTGSIATDGITADGRVAFVAVPGAVRFEYRVGSGAYLSATPGAPFLPVGLVQGANTVSIHAVDAEGRVGPDASITFTLDTVAPTPVAPSLAPGSDSGPSATDGITNVTSPTWLAVGATTDTFALLRNGVVVATRQGPGPLREPSVLASGTYHYAIAETDAAGNVGTSASSPVSILATPPPAPYWIVALSGSRVQFLVSGTNLTYQYQVNGTGSYVSIGSANNFIPAGLVAGENNVVTVRAVDLAGNVGPGLSVTVAGATVPLSATWLGQDGSDYTGPRQVAAPDGFQDVHIALAGLPTTSAIVGIELRGVGGGLWQTPAGAGAAAAVLVRAPGSTTGDLYFQPTQVETGRSFTLTIRLADGSTRALLIRGGAANPKLADPAPARASALVAASAATATSSSPGQTTLSPLAVPAATFFTSDWVRPGAARHATVVHRAAVVHRPAGRGRLRPR